MSAAEETVLMALQPWWAGITPSKAAAEIVAALRADPAALADLRGEPESQNPAILRARAEKAEAELRLRKEAAAHGVEFWTGPPMTTVDEDGNVYRLERVGGLRYEPEFRLVPVEDTP